MEVDDSSSAAAGDLHGWLKAKSLDAAFERAFDEDGFPRDAPSSCVRLLATELPPALFQQVLIASTTDHVPLSSTLNAQYHGQPREHFSVADLKRGFEIFLPEAQSLVGKEAKPLLQPALAKTAGATGADGAPAPPPPSAGAGGAAASSSSSWSGAEEAARLAAVELMTLDAEQLAHLNQTVLQPAWNKLRALAWRNWPKELDDGNPFVVKINPTNQAKLGVPDYCKIIEKPMSLAKIQDTIDLAYRAWKKKQEADEKKDKNAQREKAEQASAQDLEKCYHKAEDFIADLQLIVANAKRYNCPAIAKGRGEFPHPSLVLPEHQAADKGGFDVYSMAFDFEEKIKTLEPLVLKEWKSRELPLKQKNLQLVLALQEKKKREQQLKMQQAFSSFAATSATTTATSSTAAAGIIPAPPQPPSAPAPPASSSSAGAGGAGK